MSIKGKMGLFRQLFDLTTTRYNQGAKAYCVSIGRDEYSNVISAIKLLIVQTFAKVILFAHEVTLIAIISKLRHALLKLYPIMLILCITYVETTQIEEITTNTVFRVGLHKQEM
jgi:hypothetical protein